jgi:hypothetical protein
MVEKSLRKLEMRRRLVATHRNKMCPTKLHNYLGNGCMPQRGMLP